MYCPDMSCIVLYHLDMSCTYCPVLSCPFMSCNTMSCYFLSCPVKHEYLRSRASRCLSLSSPSTFPVNSVSLSRYSCLYLGSFMPCHVLLCSLMCSHVMINGKFCDFRVCTSIRYQPNFKQRFAWFISQNFVIVGSIWIYTLFGASFTYVPSEYQWILGLVSPLPKMISTKLLLYVCYKSAEPESYDKHSIKITCLHFMETKHVVFCSVIVGSVASQTTMYCILGVRCAIVVFKCCKLIYEVENGQCPRNKCKYMQLPKNNLLSKFLSLNNSCLD